MRGGEPRAAGRAARVVAQAKINLTLRVLAREESGYHQIETLFCRLDVGDDVGVRVTSGGRALDCRGADVGPVERNLAYRAAALYADTAAWPRGFAIELDKRIPVGAGLGGGSADAGAVLRSLNALNPAPLPTTQLLAIATRLGADVPYLASDAPLALAWGRGDRMIVLPPLPPRPVVLLVPPFPVETEAAYEWLDQAMGGPGITGEMPEHHDGVYSLPQVAAWDSVMRIAANAFSRVVARRHPEIDRYLGVLGALGGCRIAQLTGSGSALFGVFDRDPDLAPLAALEGCRAIRTDTVGRVAQVEVID